MTIKEKIESMLHERGLFEDQIQEIMEIAMNDKSLESMKRRWNEPTEAYPSQLMAVLWINVKDFALEWIDENLPKAWFRPLFEEAL